MKPAKLDHTRVLTALRTPEIDQWADDVARLKMLVLTFGVAALGHDPSGNRVRDVLIVRDKRVVMRDLPRDS